MDVVCEPETAKEMDRTKLKHYTNAEINLFHPLFVKLNTVSWARAVDQGCIRLNTATNTVEYKLYRVSLTSSTNE